MARDVLVVRGYRDFLRAADRAGRESKRAVRDTLRDVGEIVRRDAADRFEKYDARSAAGYKVRVRQRGVAVEQSLRKTTGKRPDYGALQMRKALLPAAISNEKRVELQFSRALDKVADHFEKQ
jgi:hypothetical protein